MIDGHWLILHKVRGNPSFDIAVPVSTSEEEVWVVASSGHRAYPYWKIELKDFVDLFLADLPSEMPEDLPDHFEARPSKDEKLPSVDVLKLLGIGSITPQATLNFKRRI